MSVITSRGPLKLRVQSQPWCSGIKTNTAMHINLPPFYSLHSILSEGEEEKEW